VRSGRWPWPWASRRGRCARFSQPLDYLADVLEHPELTGDLANLRMRRSLRLMARHPRLPELLERLEGADGAPWGQLRAALGG
jgi:hypothetical protein